jgi:hypothetical protein
MSLPQGIVINADVEFEIMSGGSKLGEIRPLRREWARASTAHRADASIEETNLSVRGTPSTSRQPRATDRVVGVP